MFAPSQREAALLFNDASHWLDTSLNSSLRYPPETHLKFKSQKIYNIHFSRQIILKICTEHDSDTVARCEKCKTNWLVRNKTWANEISRDLSLRCGLCIYLVLQQHYGDVIMSTIASQIAGALIVHSSVCSDQRKHQSSVSLAFEKGIHRWPVDYPNQEPVTRKMFPFDDVIKNLRISGARIDSRISYPLLCGV